MLDVVVDVEPVDVDPTGPGQLELRLLDGFVKPGRGGDPLGDMATNGLDVERAVVGEKTPTVDHEQPAHVHRGSLGLHPQEAGVQSAQSLGDEWPGRLAVLDFGGGSASPAAKEIVEPLVETGDQLGWFGDGGSVDVEPDARRLDVGHQADVQRGATGGSERVEAVDRGAGDRQRVLHSGHIGQSSIAALDHAGDDADRQGRRKLLECGGQALADPDRRLVGGRAQAAPVAPQLIVGVAIGMDVQHHPSRRPLVSGDDVVRSPEAHRHGDAESPVVSTEPTVMVGECRDGDRHERVVDRPAGPLGGPMKRLERHVGGAQPPVHASIDHQGRQRRSGRGQQSHR